MSTSQKSSSLSRQGKSFFFWMYMRVSIVRHNEVQERKKQRYLYAGD
jgi:hypothetical protein